MAFGNILYKTFYWRALQMGSSFLLNILLARLLQSAASAQFYSLLYIFGLFASFFTAGLDIGLNYFITRGQLSVASARRIIVGIALPALLITTGLLFLFHGYLPFSGVGLGMLLLFAGCQIAGTLLTTLAGAIFTAFGRNHWPIKLGVYANGVMILLALLDFRFYGGGQAIHYLFLLYFLFSLAQGLLVFYHSGGLAAGQQRTNEAMPVTPRLLLRFCFFSFIVNFLFFVGGRIGIYLLPYRSTPAALGNYIQVYKLVEYLGLVTAFLYYPFVTLAAGDHGARTKELVVLLVRLSNTLVLLVSLGGIALGHFVFPLLFGPSFHGMYTIFLGFIPGMFALCSSTFFTAWYFGTGHIRYNLMSALVQLAVVLLLYFPLTARWDVRGAAFAYSGGALASLAYDYCMFRRSYPVRIQDMLLIRPADWRLVKSAANQLIWRTDKNERSITSSSIKNTSAKK